MESYQEILYSITFVGFLNSKPLLYQSPEGEKQAEFFVRAASYSGHLNRIFVNTNEAEKIRTNGYPGAKLFLEDELIKYSIINLNDEIHIIPEIFAKKIWFLNTTEPKECAAEKTDNENFSRMETNGQPLRHLLVTLH